MRNNAPRRSSGFTMVELLIVIGIIGILSAIALPIYGEIRQNAANQVVNTHYKEAVRYVRLQGMTLAQGVASGAISATNANSAFADSAGWIAALNQNEEGLAPGGGNAYTTQASGNASTGAVGVSVSASADWNDPSAITVTVGLPAYGGLTAETTPIAMADFL